MKKTFIILLILVVGVACRKQEAVSYVSLDLAASLSDPGSDKMTFTDIADVVRVIPIETNDSTLLDYMSIAGVTENHIVVNDGNAVYFVNKGDGRVSSRISRQGRGVGEYVKIFNATVNEADRVIYLFDANLRKLNAYTFDGRFLRAVQNDSIGGHMILNDGNFATFFAPYSKTKYRLAIYDRSWNLIRESIDRPTGQKFAMYYFDIMNRFNGECYYRPALTDTLYHLTSQGETPYLVLSKGKYKIPAEVTASLEKLDEEGYRYIQQDYGMLASNYFFLTYYYDRKEYHDIWDIKTSSLIYRSKYGREGGHEGIPVSVNGTQIYVWPRYVDDDHIYCTIQGENAVKLFPSLPDDTNPVILELKIKGK